jgi:hypothetical protein
VRQKTLLQRLYVRLGGVITTGSIRISLHYDEIAPPRIPTFIEPYCRPHHLGRFATSCNLCKHPWLPFLVVVAKAPLSIVARTLLNRALVSELERASTPREMEILLAEA